MFFADVLACCVISIQAERIMEALELYKAEARKMEEHKYACERAGKEVDTYFLQPLCDTATLLLPILEA